LLRSRFRAGETFHTVRTRRLGIFEPSAQLIIGRVVYAALTPPTIRLSGVRLAISIMLTWKSNWRTFVAMVLSGIMRHPCAAGCSYPGAGTCLCDRFTMSSAKESLHNYKPNAFSGLVFQLICSRSLSAEPDSLVSFTHIARNFRPYISR